jgi:hypothetical protein
MVDNNENIFVDFDYNNITIIDPNKVVDNEGKIKDRNIKQENLVMYANLECKLLPRTKLAVGVSNDDSVNTISLASINFLNQGTKDGKLNNKYTDEITGKDTLKGEGVNQSKLRKVENPKDKNDYFYRQEILSNGKIGSVNNGMLGITSIEIRQGLDFLPTIRMTLEDIKGRAMFESGENSPYAAFFNLPYPKFYLTIKGYYGKAVKLTLMLNSFTSRYDTGDGNFKIDLVFYTYKYSILSEIQMGSVLATPHMYRSKIKIQTNNNTSSQFKNVEEGYVEGGYEKIKEVYSGYKSRGLIDKNFPELTILQLKYRINDFIKNTLNTYAKQNLDPLTNIDDYKKALRQYEGEILFFKGGDKKSWFEKYMDKNNFYILNDGTRVYQYTKEILDNPQSVVNAQSELKSIIDRNNELLLNNPTLGKEGNYSIQNRETKDTKINININEDLFIPKNFTEENINLKETIKQIKNIPNATNDEIKEFISEITLNEVFNTIKIVKNSGREVKINKYFVFEGPNTFIDETNKINKNLRVFEDQIKNDLADGLNDLLRSSGDNGIGFVPTIRNVLAVMFANVEGFLRLLDDVHRQAWSVNGNPYRRAAILGNDVNNVNPDNLDSGVNEQIPVYPWPMYIVSTEGSDSKELYELAYPGDSKYINQTKGYLYDIWPEVEFVEEFIQGFTERGEITESDPTNFNEETQTKRVSLNAIEYPINNRIYENKEEVKFIYEIYERTFLSSNYSGLVRFINDTGGLDFIGGILSESEKTNILDSLSNDNPFIIKKLKELNINATNFVEILKSISNQGSGESYQNFIRGIFNTKYINDELNNGGVSITSTNEFNQSGPLTSLPNVDKFQERIKSTNLNDFTLLDTYPFTNIFWVKNNLESGKNISPIESVLNTSRTIVFNDSKKVISNFVENYLPTQVRPITNFNYLENKVPSNYKNNLTGFYNFRTPNLQLPTEGNLNYINYSGGVTPNQTVSMLNTPYFINSIIEGVNKVRNDENDPFVSSAYLFINSLPLSTLKEKYSTFTDGSQVRLDYIFASFKKFGAVHKLPYAWILKIGSEWYRYKKYTETGIDILNLIWSDFDSENNYDPITNLKNKEYKLNINGNPYNMVLQKTTTTLNVSDTIINTGFYPKLINDFSYFYTGKEVLTNYSDNEIQWVIDNYLTLTKSDEATINYSDETKNIKVVPWSVLFNSISDSYVIPSNGSLINQTKDELIVNGKLKTNLTDNDSMYNGSVRLLWSAPNYGYFDNSKVSKPTSQQRLKEIFEDTETFSSFIGGLTNLPKTPQNFSLNGDSTRYSDISEIFSVFEKNVLDLFETEFLKFSQSEFNIDKNDNPEYKNFQKLFKNLMRIQNNSNLDGNNLISDLHNNQTINFINTIKGFLEFDVIFKYGNPLNFDKRLLYNFSSTPVVDTFNTNQYVLTTPNALPSKNNGVTLSQSESNYPNEWRALKTYVGFSNIFRLKYSDNGSYITDFFIDNNIEFSVNNIENFSPIIKIYATQKLKNNDLNKDSFRELVDVYVNKTNILQNTFINNLMTGVRAGLPNVSETRQKNDSKLPESNLNKLELWDTFKSLNDKWIAGNDFSTTTLFEDVLLLDRASRNIGNDILVDLYKLQDRLYNIENRPRITFFGLINSILVENNFVVMNLPSYVNFYNQQNVNRTTNRPESSLESANTIFGTFTNVDYRESSTKMICFYGSKPSEHLDLKNNVDYRYRNDSFSVLRNSPLADDLKDKKDQVLSNKVVGFNVDIGPQNQSIFYGFRVSQDPGKATAESLEVTNQMANLYGGRKSASQSVSLFNLYKNRSYSCTISMLGCALIQPTMYFNLRYVPMFHGPYMITSVNHTISPGTFETIFEGVRQPVYGLPKTPDVYIQTLKTTFLKNVLDRNKKDRQSSTSTTTASNNIINQKNEVTNDLLSKQSNTLNSSSGVCQDKLFSGYQSFIDQTLNKTTNNIKTVVNIIRNKISDSKLRNVVFSSLYLNSYNGSLFETYGNNYSGIKLTEKWAGSLSNFFEKDKYYCSSNKTPFAIFETIEKNIDFQISRYKDKINSIKNNNAEDITKFLILNTDSNTKSNNVYDDLDNNTKRNIENEVKKAIELFDSIP